jgi:hypothetical protein
MSLIFRLPMQGNTQNWQWRSAAPSEHLWKAFIERMRGVAKRLMDPRLIEGSEEHTNYCVTGSSHDSLSGIESPGSGADGRSNKRMV